MVESAPAVTNEDLRNGNYGCGADLYPASSNNDYTDMLEFHKENPELSNEIMDFFINNPVDGMGRKAFDFGVENAVVNNPDINSETGMTSGNKDVDSLVRVVSGTTNSEDVVYENNECTIDGVHTPMNKPLIKVKAGEIVISWVFDSQEKFNEYVGLVREHNENGSMPYNMKTVTGPDGAIFYAVDIMADGCWNPLGLPVIDTTPDPTATATPTPGTTTVPTPGTTTVPTPIPTIVIPSVTPNPTVTPGQHQQFPGGQAGPVVSQGETQPTATPEPGVIYAPFPNATVTIGRAEDNEVITSEGSITDGETPSRTNDTSRGTQINGTEEGGATGPVIGDNGVTGTPNQGNNPDYTGTTNNGSTAGEAAPIDSDTTNGNNVGNGDPEENQAGSVADIGVDTSDDVSGQAPSK